MSDLWLLIIGIGLGVAFSAPVGPVNLMCIQQAFERGFLGGLAAGIGAVIADGCSAAIAAYGTTAIQGVFLGWSRWLQLAGGIVLMIFGWRTYVSRPKLSELEPSASSLLATAASSFGLTITNPAAALGFIALFGSLGDLAPAPRDFIGATALLVGVVIGGTCWWMIVAATVAAVRSRMTDRTLIQINRYAGVLLMLIGGAMLVRLAFVSR